MKPRFPTSFVFRVWTQAHDRPMRLSKLRLMWHEARRFVQERVGRV